MRVKAIFAQQLWSFLQVDSEQFCSLVLSSRLIFVQFVIACMGFMMRVKICLSFAKRKNSK